MPRRLDARHDLPEGHAALREVHQLLEPWSSAVPAAAGATGGATHVVVPPTVDAPPVKRWSATRGQDVGW